MYTNPQECHNLRTSSRKQPILFHSKNICQDIVLIHCGQLYTDTTLLYLLKTVKTSLFWDMNLCFTEWGVLDKYEFNNQTT